MVDTVVVEIEGLPYDDETWEAELTVMKENLEHHIEEEEGELFYQARQVLDRDELVELGERMAWRRARRSCRRPFGADGSGVPDPTRART